MTQHGKTYRRLIGSRRWRELRAEKLRANPLCEQHLKEGKIVAASVVHHIVEVESGRDDAECERLAYSWSNLQSLCRECHATIHQERGFHTSEAHKKRANDRLRQWIGRQRKTDGKE